MNKIKSTLLLSTLSLAQPTASFAKDDKEMFGFWGSVTLRGDFKTLSPNLDKFKWQIMNQSRTRDDSSKGSRFSENLLFSQIGYQMNEHASFWVGYVHDWLRTNPQSNGGFQENRPYADFVWQQNIIGDLNLNTRTRMEDRIRSDGDDGYRARQLVQLRHPLPFLNGLSAYLGDEVMFYMNKNDFGKQGLTENRVFSGLSYQGTPEIGLDLGYMGQQVFTESRKNILTHNLQANISYHF
ncbi:MAG: DUF2490 domain-containing protein [Gammaproteobacteria bacterium HGW-Gammaproteobacteria-3]|nr:MAG: DUF2490 domain-containing protein [Gammaproteobacteria bacterium HGW-Gammaproteobacteria-3]